ncbi:Protein REVERSION-TO-ETHYLENE SENSITIVITY1 [Tetrabaena socialis]|uniref:Protein REVERSION-TO-ETHYLENE SENSITIVITY1 n=1 Tax=Tetrabaena socialis TaxID=47790 RepID=A0A2J7ZTE1_9CHLO|nr:Protein REVERSION-TO-ETHYLENE SENSITIVITY1 [Tetrabaena socialis]|eukprot:PNH03544.1 Protein REVERSION-TO-ETHYLENE SENSITIVITY1 [Tetrabaena socialis]
MAETSLRMSSGPSRSGGRPSALVWSPIPLISWLLPFIGHMGVCSSTGRTFDFAGPFTVNEDMLLFGKPTRYILLDPAECRRAKKGAAGSTAGAGGQGSACEHGSMAAMCDGHAATDIGGGPAQEAAAKKWDHCLDWAAATYRLMNYSLLTTNCHCFVAHFLNQLEFRGGGWDMVNLAALMFVRGSYTSLLGLLYTWLPWAVLVTLGAYFGRLTFLYVYVATCAPLLAWFLTYTWCCWTDLSP